MPAILDRLYYFRSGVRDAQEKMSKKSIMNPIRKKKIQEMLRLSFFFEISFALSFPSILTEYLVYLFPSSI